MAEDEGTERRSEDLFEDLDKFFAPIQDVDWPEEGAPGAQPPAPGAQPPAPGSEPAAPADAPAGDAPAAAPDTAPDGSDVFDEPEAGAPIPWEEPVVPAPETGDGDEAGPEPSGQGTGGFRAVGDAEDAPGTGAGQPSGGSLARDMFGSDAGGGEPPDASPAQSPSAAGDDMFGSDAGGDDDLLPAGWATGLDDGIDVDLDVPPSEPATPAAGPEPATPAAPGERFLGEPTAEMSGEDWAELQMGSGGGDVAPTGAEGEPREPYSYMERFLPDEEQGGVPEFGYGPDPGTGAAPSGGTTGIDWEEQAPASGIDWDEPAQGGGATGIDWDEPAAGPASLEDSGPISIDDLRKAPDEYRDLPGPGPDEPGLGLAAAGAAGAAAGAEGAEGAGPVPGFGEEPAPGDLEAAAEHFAESIRDEEPGLGVPPADPFAAPDADEGPADVDLFGDPVHREAYSDQPEPLVFPDQGDGDQDDLLSFGEPEGPRTVKVSAAEGAGPSWQEPTSVEVPTEGEEEPPRPSRNLSAAIVTGVVLAVVALIALWGGKVFFALVAGAVILLAQLELYTAIRKRGYQPAVPLGLAIGALIAAGGYTKGEAGILAMTLLGALFTPLWFMATPARQRRNVVANMGMTYVGIMAVPFLGGFAMAIIHDASRAFTIMVLALAFGFDIVAYAIGTLTGNKPLAPTISPNKTREGVYGGFLVLAVLGFVVLGNIDPLTSVWQGLLVGIAAAAAATLGDLAESLAKRDLGVKDMGTIFPGHGGALDRIDSVLFVAPVVYYVVRLLLS